MTHIQEDKTKALGLANRLIKQYPNNARYVALVGSVYLHSWYFDHDTADKASATAAYEKFSHRVPADDPSRSKAQFLIKLMESYSNQ